MGDRSKNGQVFGNPARQAAARSTNGRKFSYPGYSELFCGFADPRVGSNAKADNPNRSVLEFLNGRPGFRDRVEVAGTWDVFPFIFRAGQSGLRVHAGWEPIGGGTLVLTPAAVQDWDGAREVMLRAKLAAPRLARVFADSAYVAVRFWAAWFARVVVLVVRKDPGQKGFVVKPKRWIVERTFGWLNRYRRLSKDYERTTANSTAFVYVSMIHVMVRRLAPRN